MSALLERAPVLLPGEMKRDAPHHSAPAFPTFKHGMSLSPLSYIHRSLHLQRGADDPALAGTRPSNITERHVELPLRFHPNANNGCSRMSSSSSSSSRISSWNGAPQRGTSTVIMAAVAAPAASVAPAAQYCGHETGNIAHQPIYHFFHRCQLAILADPPACMISSLISYASTRSSIYTVLGVD